MVKQISIIVIFLLFAKSFCETPVFKTSFDFINLPVSARAAGGTVSLIADRDNVLAMRSNPAMLAGINRTAAEIDFSPVITGMDIYSGAISSAIILKNGIVISPSVLYYSFGAIDAVDENGNDLHLQLSPFGLSIEGAAAYKILERLSVGGRLKYIHDRLSQKTNFWRENAFSGIAADLGMFSQHKFFRYSAGFRNLGVAFQHNRNKNEKDETRPPSSMFVGLGIIVEAEAKLGWFLECEKYFYDYMFFRTEIEIPAYRDILIIRAGTTFTPEDIAHAFGSLGGDRKQVWEYSSSNWLLASVGGTINARLSDKLLSIDIACQFRKDGLRPGLLFSGTMYF